MRLSSPAAAITLTSTLALLTGSCDCGAEDAAPVETAPPPPSPPARVAAPRSVATAAAFDLVPLAGGALLFFGPPTDAGGGLAVAPLGPLGERTGAERSVWEPRGAVAPHALEVAAASGGGRAGVAWASQEGAEVRVRVSHGAGSTFSPAEDLGPMDRPTRVRRGNLVLAGAPDGSIGLIHRRERGPCAEGESTSCVRLRARRLGRDGVSERGGMPLVIPEVCERAMPGYVWADGTWYYALCALASGVPETTLYAIRFEPRYAQADRVLEGCEPIGLSRVGSGAALMLGRCAGGRVDGVRLAEMGTQRTLLTSITRAVGCREGRPRLEVRAGQGGDLTVELSEPALGLDSLLPEDVAPPLSRAIWTGQALLVATPLGAEVSLRRYQCQDEALVRTDVLP